MAHVTALVAIDKVALSGLSATGMLAAFIERVEAQRGGEIGGTLARALIAAAEALIADLE